ncbi:hypothetical protein D3C78_1142340 [compost metagenome]
MVSTFCHAGGMIMRTPRNRSMPPVTISSSMLSMLEESEPTRLTSGPSSSRSGIRSLANLVRRAWAQLRLPVMVLISPLWARKRNGCASGHFGRVLVEKRWWNTQIAVCRRSSLRSG